MCRNPVTTTNSQVFMIFSWCPCRAFDDSRRAPHRSTAPHPGRGSRKPGRNEGVSLPNPTGRVSRPGAHEALCARPTESEPSGPAFRRSRSRSWLRSLARLARSGGAAPGACRTVRLLACGSSSARPALALRASVFGPRRGPKTGNAIEKASLTEESLPVLASLARPARALGRRCSRRLQDRAPPRLRLVVCPSCARATRERFRASPRPENRERHRKSQPFGWLFLWRPLQDSNLLPFD